VTHGEVARDGHGLARPFEHLGHLPQQRIALGEREVLVDAARDGAGPVDFLARRCFDDFLAEPPHHNALHG